MSEESKPPKKSAKLTPLAAAIIGVATGLACVFAPGVASLMGAPLLETTRQALEYGGATILVGAVISARFAPTKGDGQ